MFKCHVCGSSEMKEERVSEIFTVGDRRVLVEDIPAQICVRCGEPVFSRETTERIRRLVHDQKPTKTVPLEVFALA